jgi:Holliday junction resolvase RusA-like endonuclease
MFTIPAPPSTNSLYTNRRGGRRKTDRYATWINAAGWDLKAQKPAPLPGPVVVDITVGPRRTNADIDNKIKAVLDLMVRHKIIDDDRNVFEVRARWGTEKGCQVRYWSATE